MIGQVSSRGAHRRAKWRAASLAVLSCASYLCVATGRSPAQAQTSVRIEETGRLEQVTVRIANPSPDRELNERLADRVRTGLGLFPGDQFSRTIAELNLARARRGTPIAATALSITPGPTGGLSVTVVATLAPVAAGDTGRGALLTGQRSDLPVLYDKDGTYLRMRLEGIAMYYGNSNAWYGQPGALLSGNPLTQGKTAGTGYSSWAEGFAHAGIYGISPLAENLYVYGGISGIYSGSAGQELFTDATRGHFGVEDAFAGLVGGTTWADGSRIVLNLSAGRQKFSIGDGFLIANTASNGGNRGALQSNPRWATDTLVLAQAKYNNTKFEAFYLDPDELPVIDSKTVISGVNVETRLANGIELGGTFLHVPQSNFSYFTTTSVFSREGLRTLDARLRWQPAPAAQPGPFFAGEAALQRHDHIAMHATAWTVEAGYSFANTLPWSPTISYRYAAFSGDDPTTPRFERWDPLLSGDNGERWVQGINHFKVFQDSNLITHRFQARLRPSPSVELVPQVWLFSADETTNLGGNPAFSFLDGTFLGSEGNLTVKWFMSPQVMLQAHVAATFPSATAERTVGSDLDPWVSTMVFLRVGL